MTRISLCLEQLPGVKLHHDMEQQSFTLPIQALKLGALLPLKVDMFCISWIHSKVTTEDLTSCTHFKGNFHQGLAKEVLHQHTPMKLTKPFSDLAYFAFSGDPVKTIVLYIHLPDSTFYSTQWNLIVKSLLSRILKGQNAGWIILGDEIHTS